MALTSGRATIKSVCYGTQKRMDDRRNVPNPGGTSMMQLAKMLFPRHGVSHSVQPADS